MTTKQARPILLDGSMGQELYRRGGKWRYGEWAVAALYEAPALVQTVHEDYIRAGADVITTNTYATTRTRLRAKGMENRFKELVHVAGKLAVQARNNTGRKDVRIATSLPPLETSYASEFSLSFNEMVAEYRELIRLLDPYVDIFLGETLATTIESRALLTALQNVDKPKWISWTLHDHGSSKLRGDETIRQAIRSLANFSVDAVLVNCCTPDSIGTVLTDLKASGIPFGGYANGFVEIPNNVEIVDDGVQRLHTRTDLTPEKYAEQVQSWIDAGASIVGGCCEVGPAHIAKLRELING